MDKRSQSDRQILFFEINLSKGKQNVDILQRFSLQKDKKRISFCKSINRSKLLSFILRLKSFWRSVNPKNFLPWNKPLKTKVVKNIQRGRTICSIFRGYRSIQEFMWKGGLKFVCKFELIIPEIGGHMLAEGSRLSVPAPRRVQIFFHVCLPPPLHLIQWHLYLEF